jgi:hypothetical protein
MTMAEAGTKCSTADQRGFHEISSRYSFRHFCTSSFRVNIPLTLAFSFPAETTNST